MKFGFPTRRRAASDALGLIQTERNRHVTDEGYDAAADDRWVHGELARAAAAYALPADHRPTYTVGGRPLVWPWDTHRWQPCHDDRIRELVKAGSLIVAEIDRLQRAQPTRQ